MLYGTPTRDTSTALVRSPPSLRLPPLLRRITAAPEVRPALADQRLIMIRGQRQHALAVLRQYGRRQGQRVHGAPPLSRLLRTQTLVRGAIRLDLDLGRARDAEAMGAVGAVLGDVLDNPLELGDCIPVRKSTSESGAQPC